MSVTGWSDVLCRVDRLVAGTREVFCSPETVPKAYEPEREHERESLEP